MVAARILMALVAASIAPSVASAQDSLRALLVAYRCPVVDRIERIYEAGSPLTDRDRYLAVTVPGHPHGYVQCMFIQDRARMLCEASSGYYYNKVGAPRTFFLPRDTIAAIGRLGFSTDDSMGNFRQEFGVGPEPDFNAIADLILRTLHDGYGARGEMQLRFNAPFARRATSKCIPVS